MDSKNVNIIIIVIACYAVILLDMNTQDWDDVIVWTKQNAPIRLLIRLSATT